MIAVGQQTTSTEKGRANFYDFLAKAEQVWRHSGKEIACLRHKMIIYLNMIHGPENKSPAIYCRKADRG